MTYEAHFSLSFFYFYLETGETDEFTTELFNSVQSDDKMVEIT
jgi:hypothetical protein